MRPASRTRCAARHMHRVRYAKSQDTRSTQWIIYLRILRNHSAPRFCTNLSAIAMVTLHENSGVPAQNQAFMARKSRRFLYSMARFRCKCSSSCSSLSCRQPLGYARKMRTKAFIRPRLHPGDYRLLQGALSHWYSF